MRKFFTISFIVFYFTNILPNSALANGTSYWQSSYPPTGNVLPLEEGMVSIEGEELDIHFSKENKGSILKPENPDINAKVTVVYQLHNHLEEEIQVPVAFPQPGETENWAIMLDDDTIPLTGTVELPREQILGENEQTAWVHPRTGEEFELFIYDVYASFEALPAKTFNVSLRPKTTHLLKVEYDALLGIDEKTNLHPVYRFDYLLHPASYWSDFKNLNMTVEIPFDAVTIMNLPLDKMNEYTWSGTFSELPKEDLRMFISPDLGPFIDLFNSRGKPLLFLLIIAIVFYPLGWIIHKKLPKHIRIYIFILLTFLLTWIGYDILKVKIIGYPFTIFHPVFFGMYLLSFIIFFIMLWVRTKD